MAVEIEREHEAEQARGRFYVVPERLYKTKDGDIVPQGDPNANSLFKSAGAKIIMSEAIELGLVKGEDVAEKKQAAEKKAAKPKDKSRKPSQNKAKGGK